MPKQLNVNLAFTADTAKASQGIKSLQQQLTQLMNTAVLNSSSLGLTKDIKEATTAAAQLKAQLSSAMNANGTLDLTKFNDSLKASGMTLEQYRVKLSALGPEGTQAFSALASQISSAEIPLRRANTLLQEMGTTLMNTARWQLSSSLLHGFIGGLQHAYGYAQDLNESLNNIRIVTGQSTEQMAQFADKANKAAKELSIGTNEYAKSALIFYQQGLNDKQVEERNRTVAKLTNVTRQSAEEVSSQMTAIWNNFDNGTKSLEYYADAITALGAKTASSSSEIAEGLSKFAAVADTIGLSYETATASLATVVAETRQSADTVGNAFKSIFSRLQSLKLGETLEDGVGLTKYSEALEKVGVQVLDINGELRTADDIMSDLGDRWTEISDTQKTALAQTVAGQRQYAQFVALFDNWDKVQGNIEIAEGSEGTLQEQADIYAESWEAASKRVQASAEAIYDALISDKFFIGFNNLISGVLDRVNDLIKGLGGLPGVLTTLGSLLTKVFSAQIASNIDRITNNLTKASIKGAQQQQQEAITALQKQASVAQASGSVQGQAQAEGLKAQATLQETLIANQGRYNEEQLKTAQELLDQNTHLRDNVNEQAKILEQSEQQAKILERSLLSEVQRKANGQNLIDPANVENQLNQIKTMTYNVTELENEYITFQGLLKDSNPESFDLMIEKGEELKLRFQEIYDSVGLNDDAIREFDNALIDFISTGQGVENVTKAFDKIITELSMMNSNNIDALRDQLTGIFGSSEQAQAAISRLIEAYQKGGTSSQEFKNALEALRNSTDGTVDSLNNAKTAALTFGQQVQAVASFAMSFASVINSIRSAIDILNNEDLSFGEKMLKIIPALLMSFGMLTSAMSGASGAALITAASHIPLIGSFASEAVAANLATASTATFGVTLKAVFPILGIITGGILAIGAALKAWDETHYSFAEQMEDTEKATERAAEAAEEAKNKYEGIASAVDQYESVLSTLESCTEGTDAWREAMEKVSEVTSDLIEKYPELLDFYDSSTGLFDTDKIDKYLEVLEQQKLATQFQQIYTPTMKTQVQAEEAKTGWAEMEEWIASYREGTKAEAGVHLGSASAVTDLVQSDKYKNDFTSFVNAGSNYSINIAGEDYADFIEGMIDSLKNETNLDSEKYLEAVKDYITGESEILTQINEQIWLQLSQVRDEATGEYYADLQSFIDGGKKNKELYEAALNSYLDSITNDLDNYASLFVYKEEKIKESEGNLNTAIDRIINARLASLDEESGIVDNLTRTLLRENLQQKIQEQSKYSSDFQNLEFDEHNMDFSGTGDSLRAQDSYYVKKGAKRSASGNINWMEGFANAYIQASGQNLEFTGKAYGTDNQRTYEFLNESEQKIEITAEEMASAITLFNNGIINFNDLLNDAGLQAKKIFGEELTTDLSNALGVALNGENKTTFLSGVRAEEVQKAFYSKVYMGPSMTNEGAAHKAAVQYADSLKIEKDKFESTFGTTYEDFIKTLEEGLLNYQEGIRKLSSELGEKSRSIYYQMNSNIDKESLETQAAAKDQFKTAYLNGGIEAAQALADLYSEAGDKATLLTELDFSSFDSIENFKDNLEEVGLESLISSENLELVYNSLKRIAEESPKSASEKIAETNKITSKLSKGDTISAEDYQSLGSEGYSDLMQYFTIMADGTYRLTEDAEKFQKAVNEISLQKVVDEIENRNKEAEAIAEKFGSAEDVKKYANSSAEWHEKDPGQGYKGGNYLHGGGTQKAEVLQEQIDFLQEIGKLTDNQVFKLEQDLEDGKLKIKNLHLVHDLMLDIANDWDSINEKVENNEKLTEEDVSKLLSLTPNIQSLEKFYNSHTSLFEGTGYDLEKLVQLFKEGGYFDSSSIKTLEDYKKALKGIGDEAGLTVEQAKEAWKNIDPSTLKMSDLSFIKSEFKAGRMEAEEFKKSISVLTEKASSLSELHKLLNDATAEDYSSALQRVLNQSGTGTKKALDEIDQAILNGKADAELLGTILDRIMGASDLTSLEKVQELNDRQYSEEERIDEHSGQKVTVTKQNYTDKEKGFKQIDLAKNSDDLFDTQRLDLYNQGIANIGNTSKLTASEVRQIGEAAISIYKDSNLFDIDQQIKGIGDAFKIANGEIDPANLKIYADAIRDIVLNANDLTLDEKIEKISKELKDAGVPAEYLNKEIGELIINDKQLTLDEKLARIKKELGGDVSDELASEIEKIIANEATTTEEGIQRVKEICGDNYVLQETAAWIDKILNNNSTSTIEKLQELLQLAAEAGSDKNDIAEKMAEQYSGDITNLRDFEQLRQNNNNTIDEAQQTTNEEKTELDISKDVFSEKKQAFDSAEGLQEKIAATLELGKATAELTIKQNDYNIAAQQEKDIIETTRQSYQLYADSLEGSKFDSLEELERVQQGLIDSGATISQQAQNQNVIEYASQFDRCKEAIEEYETAVVMGADTTVQLAEVQRLAAAEDLASKYSLDADSVDALSESYIKEAEALDNLNETRLGDIEVIGDEAASLKRRNEAALDAAVRDSRMAAGKKDLVKGEKEYLKVLEALTDEQGQYKKGAKLITDSGEDLVGSYNNLRKSIANVLNVQEDLLDEKDVQKYGQKAMDAINGIGGSLEELQQEASTDHLIDLGIDVDQAEADVQEFFDYLGSINPGDVIDWSDTGAQSFLDDLVQGAFESADSIDEAISLINQGLSQAGIDADVSAFQGTIADMENAALEGGDTIVGALGINAEAEQKTIPSTDTVEVAGYDATTIPNQASITYTLPRIVSASAPGGKGEVPKVEGTIQASGTVDGVQITPHTETETTNKEETITGVKVENAHKSAGGKTSGGGGSGGGGKGGCFVAGTPITIGNTYKNIEDVKIGDIVLSYNEKLKRNEYSVVLQTMIHHVYDNIYTLYIENEKLVVTGIHRFLIYNGIYSRWIAAENLQVGDFVLFADGTLHSIDKIDIKLKSEIVYNFEVSNNHNYYVGKNQILAHNKGGGRRRTGSGRGPSVRSTTKRASATHEDNTERYRPIVQQLEKLSHAYNDVGKAQDLSFGAKHQKNLQETIKLQDKIIAKQKDYRAEIDKNIAKDKAAIEDQTNKNINAMANVVYDKKKKKFTVKKGGIKDNKLKSSTTGSVGKKENGNASFAFNDLSIKKNKSGNYTEKNVETTKYVDADITSALGKYKTGKASQLDMEGGVITNYNDLVKAADTNFNKFADYYAKNYNENLKFDPKKKNKKAVLVNNALKNEYEKRKAIHDQFLENLKQLEESLKLQAEQITAAIENEITQIQNRVAEATYTVDLKLDINDQDMKLLDYSINKLSDHARDAAAYITKVGEQMKSVNESMKTNAEGIANIIKTVVNNDKKNLKEIIDNNGETQYFNQDHLEDSSAFLNGDELLKQLESSDAEEQKKAIDTLVKAKALKTPQIEEMRNRAQNQLDMAQQLKDYYWSIFDRMESALDEWDTNMDTIIDKQTHLNTLLNGYKNVVDLIGKTQFYQDRAKGRTLEAQIDASLQTQANETIKTYQKMRDNNRAFLEDQGVKGQEGYQEGLYTKRADAKAKMEDMSLSEDVRNEWAKTYERYNEMVLEREQKSREIQENIEASFEEALQRNVDAWQNSMERITEEFQESLANNAVTLDYLADALDRYTKTHSTMVAEYEKVHQLRQMDLEAEKSINEATNPKIKRELLEIQEEISAATSHETKMSEYELTYLRQKLELKQAEAAMDDAKKAKTQVSLTRDNEGNFGYVYTADEGDVADAEKNYADKIYEMQKANAEYIQDLQTQIVTAEQEYYQKIQEITNDTSLSDKQRKAKLAQVHADYDTLHKALTDQLTFALNAGVDVYGKYSERYAEITGDITATNLAHVEDFSETQLALQTGYLDLEEYALNWKEKSKAYYVDMGKTLDAYTAATKTTTAIYKEQTDSSKNATEEYANALETELGKVSSKTTKFTKEMSTLGDTSSTAFGKILTEAGKLEKSYVGYMDNMIKRTENLVSALIKVQTELSKTNPDDFNNGNGSNGGGPGPGPGSGSGSGSGPSGKQNKLDIGKKYSKGKKKGQFVTGKGHTKKITSKNVRRVRLTRAQKKYVLKAARKQGIKAKKAKAALKELLNNYKKVVIHFDTGGYTGNWSGNNGKLAMLHQKEMVLNQKDTSNILSAVDMIRGISEKIDLNALAQSGALSSGLASGINGVTNNTLEQNVHITAEFPNATDRNEITEAFNNIIGLAAQYANR